LCFVAPFFLLIATIGGASTGASALRSRWHGRRGRRLRRTIHARLRAKRF
jgi:hypothetical protein